jgi:hypothetical protein
MHSCYTCTTPLQTEALVVSHSHSHPGSSCLKPDGHCTIQIFKETHSSPKHHPSMIKNLPKSGHCSDYTPHPDAHGDNSTYFVPPHFFSKNPNASRCSERVSAQIRFTRYQRLSPIGSSSSNSRPFTHNPPKSYPLKTLKIL